MPTDEEREPFPEAGEIPVTWPELLRAERDVVLHGLEIIGEVPARLEAVRPPRLAAQRFGGPSLTLAEAAVVVGPDLCLPPIDILLPLLPRVMSDFAAGIDTTNRVPAANLLSFFNTVQCCGAVLPVDARAAEQEWPKQIAQHLRLLGEGERHRLALTMLALGDADVVPSLIGGGALPARVAPGAVFDFNVPGFVRYLAAAMRDGVPYAAVEPAWHNFVDRFPHKLAAATLDWPDLLYAARVVYTRLRGDPLGTVAAMVHRMVSP